MLMFEPLASHDRVYGVGKQSESQATRDHVRQTCKQKTITKLLKSNLIKTVHISTETTIF